MKRATPTANQTSRVATYYRVSSAEQVEGYSLDAQQRAAHTYCESRGWQIVREYRDEGKSARTDIIAKRPAFSQMLADAEAGAFDVLIVHKLDRFSRNARIAYEAFHQLEQSRVSFVSITEQIDPDSPSGRLMQTMLVGLAQFYSDNLSQETKKGKHERKRQGLYNGLLPFGVTKDPRGVPILDTEPRYCDVTSRREIIPGEGLRLAFKAAAEGKGDREIAALLNAAGYRSSGNRGTNPFRKDSVRRILINRFYVGELPDGEGGWMPGKHGEIIDPALFDAAERTRAVNRTNPLRVARQASVYSLSSLTVCGHCGGKLHIHRTAAGRARIYCYRDTQSDDCPQRSTFLDVYEEQIEQYLETFHIPPDFQQQIMEMHRQAQTERGDNQVRRQQIDARLSRLRDLYGWGDISRVEYVTERDALTAELATLRDDDDRAAIHARAAELLGDVAAAWRSANQAQRNQLARLMFQSVEIKDNRVVAVTPQPDFQPFFILDAYVRDERSTLRKRRDSNPRSQP